MTRGLANIHDELTSNVLQVWTTKRLTSYYEEYSQIEGHKN